MHRRGVPQVIGRGTRWLAVAAACATLCVAGVAGAAPTAAQRDRASMLYRRGLAAHDRKDFAAAARDFAEADAVAPNPVALGAALDAAVDADDPVLGAELLERASSRGAATGDLAKSVATAKDKLGGRAGKVRAICAAGTSCTASLDGATVAPGAWTFARTGAHTIVFVVDGARESRPFELRGDESVDVTATRPGPTAAPAAPLPAPQPTATTPPASASPPTREPPRAPEDRGAKVLPPLVFWIAAGGTVVLAGGAVGAGLMTKSKHDDFASASCPTTTSEACDDMKRDGERIQLITNAAIAGAGVGLIATTVIGLWLTDWGKPDAKRGARAPAVGFTWVPGGAAATVGGRF